MLDDDQLLAGVTIPLITVLDDTGRPDPAAATPLLAAMAGARVDNLMLLGSNGEGSLLPTDLVASYLRQVADAWRGLRPEGRVIINVSAAGTIELLRRAETAAAADPDALVVSPPSGFRHRPDEIEQHLRAVTALGRRFAIYNVPRYANPLPFEVFDALLDEPLLIGIKDSSGDPATLAGFVAAARRRDDVVVSQGAEQALLAGLRAGAGGIVPGIGNLAPGLCVELFDAWQRGDDPASEQAQQLITALTAVHTVRPGVPTVKAVLHQRGLLPNARVAPPLIQTTATELAAINEILAPYDGRLIGVDHG